MFFRLDNSTIISQNSSSTT